MKIRREELTKRENTIERPWMKRFWSQGASFGYHAGGWGKPPVDEQGKPLYGDVFGIQSHEAPMMEEDEQIESQPWGELESESEEESESEVRSFASLCFCSWAGI